MKNKHSCKISPNHDQADDFFRNINIQFLIHELKGPLDVIQTNIRMLLEFRKQYGALTKLQEKALKRSIRSASKMREIIYSLLEVGSSQTGRINLEHFEAAQCTTEILLNSLETVLCSELDVPETHDDLTAFLSSHGVYLEVSPEVQGVILRQDKTKYKYILGNLVRNSLQYKDSRVTVQLALKGPDLQVSVCDDGVGIAPEDRKAMFKRYKQNNGGRAKGRRKGHGLGLASSRILARYLGGDIIMDSQVDRGALFVLRLPLSVDDSAVKDSGYEVHEIEDSTTS